MEDRQLGKATRELMQDPLYNPGSIIINSHLSPADPFYGHRYKAQYHEPPEAAVDLALTAFILNKPLMLHAAWLTHRHGSLFARLRHYPPTEEFKTEWQDLVQAWLVEQIKKFPEMSLDVQKSFNMPEKRYYNDGVGYRFQIAPKASEAPVKVPWFKQHADQLFFTGAGILVAAMFFGLYCATH